MDSETTTEFALVTGAVASLTQNVKQTTISNKLMPYVAIVLGAVIGVCYAPMTGSKNYVQSGVIGLCAGLSSSGLFDGAKTVVGLFSKKSTTINSDVPTQGGTENEVKKTGQS